MSELRIPYIDHNGDLKGLYERWLESLDITTAERDMKMEVFMSNDKWWRWNTLMRISGRQRDEDHEAFASAQGGLGVMGPSGQPGRR